MTDENSLVRIAQVEGGVVVNITMADPENLPDWCADWPVVDGPVGIGWVLDGEGFAPPAPDLDAMRARMIVSPAQMRLALHRAGLLATVQQIVSADPEAEIVFEYATRIERNSPLIEALQDNPTQAFSPAEIDAIFAAAAAI